MGTRLKHILYENKVATIFWCIKEIASACVAAAAVVAVMAAAAAARPPQLWQ